MAEVQALAAARERAEAGVQLDPVVGRRLVLPDRMRNHHGRSRQLPAAWAWQFFVGGRRKGRNFDLATGLLTLLAIIVADGHDRLAAAVHLGGKIQVRICGVIHRCAIARDVRRVSRRRSGGHASAAAVLVPPYRATVRAIEALPSGPQLTPEQSKRVGQIVRTLIIGSIVLFTLWALVSGFFALVRTLSQPWPSDAKQIPEAIVLSTIRMTIAYAISLAWTVPCALAASEKPASTESSRRLRRSSARCRRRRCSRSSSSS